MYICVCVLNKWEISTRIFKKIFSGFIWKIYSCTYFNFILQCSCIIFIIIVKSLKTRIGDVSAMGIQTKVRRTKISNKSLEVIVTGKSSEDLTRQTKIQSNAANSAPCLQKFVGSSQFTSKQIVLHFSLSLESWSSSI